MSLQAFKWLLLVFLPCTCSYRRRQAFVPPSQTGRIGSLVSRLNAKSSFSVPSSELEKDLSPDERNIVGIFRKTQPSVAFVATVWPRPSSSDSDKPKSTTSSSSNLPPGMSLGAGSAFCVDERGYLVTNYHVIARAYELQKSVRQSEDIFKNITDSVPGLGNLVSCLNETVSTRLKPRNGGGRRLQQQPPPLLQNPVSPEVYVRINSATQYRPCRIVTVEPDLDIAVLKIMDKESENSINKNSSTELTKFTPMSFGSSSDLLVGQNLIAIGNPFGLDTTVTTGVVSALGREISASTGPGGTSTGIIRNCIQTDCAINPGNSGGPLLNGKGEVVGVNCAILTTSSTGANVGIGFAIPSDSVKPVVEEAIRQDEVMDRKSNRPYLGVSIVKSLGGSNILQQSKTWIAKVAPDSPASRSGMRGLTIDPKTATIEYGDAIVAVGGNNVTDFPSLVRELRGNRFPGEQVAVTLLDAATGERRVAYLTLKKQAFK